MRAPGRRAKRPGEAGKTVGAPLRLEVHPKLTLAAFADNLKSQADPRNAQAVTRGQHDCSCAATEIAGRDLEHIYANSVS
jgi:hypothetical protein